MKKYSTQAIDLNILSVFDITDEGKVVSAKVWTELWELVIRHINVIDAYCVDIDDIRTGWEQSEELLNARLADFDIKWEALSESFVHYGDTEPTNEHTKLWLQPVEDVDPNLTVTKQELKEELEKKVGAFTGLLDGVLTLDLAKTVALTDNDAYLIEQYRVAETDVSTIKVLLPNRTIWQSTRSNKIPKDSNVTVVHTRSGGVNATEFNVRITVMLDSAWLVPPTQWSSVATISCNGYHAIDAVATKNGDTWNISNRTENFYRADVLNVSTFKQITLQADVEGSAASHWIRDDSGVYYQQFKGIQGITPFSKIDITPTPAQLYNFYGKGYSFVVENTGGTIKVYCIGKRPTEDTTLQVTVTEVNV